MICSNSYYKDVAKSIEVNNLIKAQMAIEFLCNYFHFNYKDFLFIILDAVNAVNKNFKENIKK